MFIILRKRKKTAAYHSRYFTYSCTGLQWTDVLQTFDQVCDGGHSVVVVQTFDPLVIWISQVFMSPATKHLINGCRPWTGPINNKLISFSIHLTKVSPVNKVYHAHAHINIFKVKVLCVHLYLSFIMEILWGAFGLHGNFLQSHIGQLSISISRHK